ncbi:MAG: hypothetical protein KGL39_17980 [Patescibacteria group bacterium]|nr:hypothetical protein [Patescibacteria group bacterium]
MTQEYKHTPAQYLRDLSERLMAVPGMYGTDQGDCDALNEIAELIASAPDLLAERDRLRAVNAELVEALEWVAYHWENQDMNHMVFRVEAAHKAHAALVRAKEG